MKQEYEGYTCQWELAGEAVNCLHSGPPQTHQMSSGLNGLPPFSGAQFSQLQSGGPVATEGKSGGM